MTNKFVLLVCILFSFSKSFGQSTIITPGNSTPNIVANSTTNGVVPPRMTFAQINNIANPIVGTLVYDLESNCLRMWDGTRWVCLTGQAQTGILSVANYGGSGSESLIDVATDANGNIYMVGFFSGSANFNSNYLYPNGQNDVFVVKLNSDGSTAWAKNFGGTTNDFGRNVVIDSFGNVIIGGTFSGSCNFGGGTITATSTNDIFILKLNSLGVFQSVQTFGNVGTTADFGGMAIDTQNNIIFTGSFDATLNLGAITLNSFYYYDGFVAKMNASGTILWAKNYNNNATDGFAGVITDNSNNIYFTGRNSAYIDFGGGFSSNSNGAIDIVIVKLNANGDTIWAKSYGGTEFDELFDIKLDINNNIYCTGYFWSSISFNGISLTSLGSADIFVLKMSNSGTPIWAKSAGGPLGDQGYGIEADDLGNVYVTGRTYGNVSFGNYQYSGASNFDAFMAKYDSNGNITFLKKIGVNYEDKGKLVLKDPFRNIYFFGAFQTQTQVNNQNLYSNGSDDIFMIKVRD